VARLFGISERTLRQKLQAEGTSMQRLLAQTRFELARHLLLNTRQPMSLIAAALCYADSAVFSRAFHAWAGMGPKAWRARHSTHSA
jgi:AraC-like DNA-binding protein